MAQIKPFDWYQQESAPAFAGMKADTSLNVVDGFASEGGVNPGEAVIRGTDTAEQCKAVSATGDGAKVIGIAVHVHREPQTDSAVKYYEAGYQVPVMTFGDVYVVAGGTVTAGDTVALTIASSAGAFVASTTASAEAVSGMTYLDSGVKGELVRVRVRK